MRYDLDRIFDDDDAPSARAFLDRAEQDEWHRDFDRMLASVIAEVAVTRRDLKLWRQAVASDQTLPDRPPWSIPYDDE